MSVLFVHLLVAQSSDTLLFLNGKQLEGNVLEFNKYQLTFKTLKNKEIDIENYRLFSMKWNGIDTTIYKYDSLEGNFLSQKDMKLFVYGERDAHLTYSSKFSNVLGFAVGSGAGYFMHYDQSFIYISTPLVYTLGTLIFPTRVKQRKIKDLQYIKEDEYLRGHERVARAKRTQSALISTLIGLGVGFTASLIAN
ncbi:MAG: hypothetical protein COW67_05430 [Flavobacteriales bacterium CG18_big_fil_WC_8_21_14_2_50_32_9]|nr:MAG: hypothetical protein COW67_05430 [Flavobacteriales bacterium CG18_big_fil_WC_8_21_14_2_50_32_9]